MQQYKDLQNKTYEVLNSIHSELVDKMLSELEQKATLQLTPIEKTELAPEDLVALTRSDFHLNVFIEVEALKLIIEKYQDLDSKKV